MTLACARSSGARQRPRSGTRNPAATVGICQRPLLMDVSCLRVKAGTAKWLGLLVSYMSLEIRLGAGHTGAHMPLALPAYAKRL